MHSQRPFALPFPQLGVPVMAGTPTSVDLLGARAFMEKLGAPILLKAVAGGGGRGIRAVHSIEDLAGAFDACQREAVRSFGEGAVLFPECPDLST